MTRKLGRAKDEHHPSFTFRLGLAVEPLQVTTGHCTGIARDGRPLKPPMTYGFYAALKDADLADIVTYLRAVPPLQ